MRFPPLGYGVLLVLILGLLSSTHSHYGSQVSCSVDVEPEQEAIVTVDTKDESIVHPPSSSSVSSNQSPDLQSQQNQDEPNKQGKRNLGMPASSRELSGPPEGGLSSSGMSSSSSPSMSTSNQVQAVDAEEKQDNRQEPSATSSDKKPSRRPDPNETFAVPIPEQIDAEEGKPAPSTARGMMSSLTGSGSSQSQSGSSQASPVRQEDLPTIIENNKPVSPQSANGSMQPPVNDPKQQQSSTATTLVENNNNNNNQQQQQSTALNTSLPMSSARTFDSWTNCVGAASNKYGTCKNDVECGKSKGTADGSCMGGLGVCCIVALSCGDKSFENNTFFANSDYPEPSWEARLCEVELKKKHMKILQIMIEFVEFELAPPNQEGECITDVFQVKLASNKPSPYSLLRICGQNTGQHMYLDVSQVDEPLLLSVATSGGGFPRRWSIRIVQMDEHNHLLAPPGCLQYYTDTIGHFRSFNLGRNLRNLYYAICFRIDNGYSGIRFTENFFGMNGPFCRKRIGGGSGSGGLIGVGGRFNQTGIVAHPHHLVIPPPGYGAPLPRPNHQLPPKYQQAGNYEQQQQLPPMQLQQQTTIAPYQQQQQAQQIYQQPPLTRYKRLAYAESPTSVNERQQRTLDPHHNPHFENLHHGGFGGQQPPQSGQFGPPPPPNYGPPPGHYGGESKEFGIFKEKNGEEKFFGASKHSGSGHHQHHPHEHESSKSWGWNAFGWVGGKKDKEFDKEVRLEHSKYAGHGGKHYGGYGAPEYGPSYGYGKYSGYGGGNGYGYGPGYGKPYGGYHHKEIDKFGEQYEHLEYKHEKNHLGKEKEVSKSSWWPSWGTKKEEKKLEKFQQHHEALFPLIHIPEMPHCEPRFCGTNDVITFPPSGDSIAEMCGNRFNRGKGPKIISGSPLVVYVSNRGHTRGAGFDMNYEQVFYIPRPY